MRSKLYQALAEAGLGVGIPDDLNGVIRMPRRRSLSANSSTPDVSSVSPGSFDFVSDGQEAQTFAPVVQNQSLRLWAWTIGRGEEAEEEKQSKGVKVGEIRLAQESTSNAN